MKSLLLYLKNPKLFFGFFLIFLFTSCFSNKEEKGKAIVLDGVEAHGSMKTYKALSSLSFTKQTKLYKEDGRLESDVTQKQFFQFKPEFLTEIDWEAKGKLHKIFYNGSKAIKTINGQVVNDSLEVLKAENAAKAAFYVFFQPFKLIEDDPTLVYEGELQLNDSTNTKVVRVAYKNDTENSDKWKYYFNDDDILVANSVTLTDHNSLIENHTYQKVNGLLFNKYRKSYRVDKDLNKKYLRAEYWYTDVKFK